MPQPLFTDFNLHDLTLEERAALERAVDGPITPAMIADKLRGRATAPVPKNLRCLSRLTSWAAADLAFYRRQVEVLEAEIATLMADREGIYEEAEKDRKTRHIAALNRQRDDLYAHCGLYQRLIDDGRTKPAETLQSPTTCTPFASRHGRSEG